jgi:hypothetical protein
VNAAPNSNPDIQVLDGTSGVSIQTFDDVVGASATMGSPVVDLASNKLYYFRRFPSNQNWEVRRYDPVTNALTTGGFLLTAYNSPQGLTGAYAVDEGLQRVFAYYGGRFPYPSGPSVRELGAVNASSGAPLLARVPLPLAANPVIDSAAHKLYATVDAGGGNGGLTTIDTGTYQVTPPVTTSPDLMGQIVATDFANGRLWLAVGRADAEKLVEVDLGTGTITGGIGAFGSAVWDPSTKRLYATNQDHRGNNTLIWFGDIADCLYDTTTPSASIVDPPPGATYSLGSSQTVDLDCADEPGGSGLAMCEALVFNEDTSAGVQWVQDGDPLPTGTVGSYRLTVYADDVGGNFAPRTQVTYSVTPNADSDVDDDGVSDDIDVGAGAFDDGDGTVGSLVDANGHTVLIENSADGVKITVGGGAGQATITACGIPSIKLSPGEYGITCGSVIVDVVSGTANAVLDGGLTIVSIPAGASARVTDTANGARAEHLSGGGITVTVDGVTSLIAPGSTREINSWDFTGFFAPVDNSNPPDEIVLNQVKAGRAVPLKWKLADAQGSPVTTLASATVTVEGLECGLADTSDDLEQTFAGGSGLQNLGGGNYQLNWKTSAALARSCKIMHLDFGDGIRHDAYFKFVK